MNTVITTKPKLPGYISLLLVAILGIILAKLMWLIITPKSEVVLQALVEGSVAPKPKAKTNYGKLIANHHLFGKVVLKKAPVVKTPQKVEVPVVAPTKLNLKLHGIVAYKGSKRGFALISTGSGPQKVFGKGDEIQKGVTVSEVFSDKVVLDNNGKDEDLMLPVNKTKSASKRATSFELGGNSAPAPARAAPASSKNTPDLSKFRQDVQADPRKLLDIAKPSPAMINGKFAGFRVQPGRKRKMFRQLGFRPNDIITEVNGIILDDPSKSAMVLGELSQASEVNVKVLRGDQEIFISHSF